MMKTFIKMAFVLAPITLSAQDKGTILTTYIAPYVGVTYMGEMNTEQTGTAHKRGNFNAFSTDFDLQVDVTGKSESAIGNTYGLTYGSVWNKQGRKLNPGFEIDLFHTSTSHKSELANANNEEVTNIVGANGDSVIAFVEEHYGAGHHEFSNKMTMNSWNAAANLTLSYGITSKISINGAVGIGFTAITLKDAESLQVGPAAANPGYETTSDNGGGAVNHFNSHPHASDNLMFGQFRIGANFQLVQKVALRIDARGMYRGEGEFNFGSTKYTDHAPTDNWTYTIDKGVTYMLTAGVVVSLK
jgi:hypothetical protein